MIKLITTHQILVKWQYLGHLALSMNRKHQLHSLQKRSKLATFYRHLNAIGDLDLSNYAKNTKMLSTVLDFYNGGKLVSLGK